MKFSLREFKTQDSDAVKNLILNILSDEYPFDKGVYCDSDISNISETYGGKKDAFFVAEANDRIVGTVGIKHETESDALLRRLFVDPHYRSLGCGAALIDMAVKFCVKSGYKKLYFRCTDRMANAINLCKKKGFKELEVLPVSGFNIHKLELTI